MYGAVNQAAEDLVIATAGVDAWNAIKATAGLEDTQFIETKQYEDELTFRLVGAASEVLMESPEVLLQLFGRQWIMFTVKKGWISKFALASHDVISFLEQINAMHARVTEAMPDANRMPQFKLLQDSDGYLFEYRSEREGLAPMVKGILEGLAEHYEEPWVIKLHLSRPEHHCDVFSLRTVENVLEKDLQKAS